MDQAHTVAAEDTSTGLNHRKLLMWTFLASECLFFGTLISNYLINKDMTLTGPTPRQIFDIPYTSVSTFVLLMSSLMMVLALAALQRGDERNLRIWLFATAFLGMTFLGGQAYEFSTFFREGLNPGTSAFGSAFFTLTGFHGAHVTIGVIWLLSLVVHSARGKLGPKDALNVEIAGLYWHFVDVVWIVIFTVVYLIGAI